MTGRPVALVAVMNTPTRLLLVEDEPTALAALRKFFRTAGFQVDCALELEEAEALIATTDYDVVITDLRLSTSCATDGLEVLRFIRCHSRETHVVVLSAHATSDIRDSLDALGAEAFISKPAPLPAIAETVWRVLGRPA
jgi:DNA-binding response OmpR family regulator